MTGFLSIKTEILRRGSSRRCILSSNVFQLFVIFVSASILHAAQFVQLHKCELGFTQLAKMRLSVISCYILICTGTTFVKLVKDHEVFMQHLELVRQHPEAVLLEYFQLCRQAHQVHLLALLVQDCSCLDPLQHRFPIQQV